MFVKHGLRSAARMPGKTALTFALVLLVAAMLGTSLGLAWSVRRTLAQGSREILDRYRRGEPIAPDCPLAAALK